MLRACLYLLFFAPWTIFCALAAMLSSLLDSSGRLHYRVALVWSRLGLLAAGVRLAVAGRELIPAAGPVIFMGNHQSNFDVMSLFQAVPRQFAWLAKEELFRVPVFGASMKSAGYIPVNRGDGREALRSLELAAGMIGAGTSVAIFPEGTRSSDGKLLPFKRGGFILAAKAGVPIIPFSIRGSRQVNPPDNFLFLRPGRIEIRFGAPIAPTAKPDPGKLMERVRAAITAGLEN